MKTTEPELARLLAGHLPADLPGLTAKHTRQMQQKIADAARQLTKRHARLLAKEQRASAKKQHRAAKVAVHGLVRQVFGALARPGAAARYLRRTKLAA